MSKVFKWDRIVFGEEKLIKLKDSPIIKAKVSKVENKPNAGTSREPQTIIEEAQTKANAIIEAAKIESEDIINKSQIDQEAIISEAFTESNKIFENARQKGYEEGFAQGQEAGLQTVDSLIAEAKQIKQDILNERKLTAKRLEKDMIELIIASVRKIIDYQLEEDDSLLLNLVESGIEKCTYTDSLIIRVSENNYEIVNSYKNRVYMMTEGIDNIEVKKDPALADGSIIIETISGTVDASLKTQIGQIEQMFYDILKGE